MSHLKTIKSSNLLSWVLFCRVRYWWKNRQADQCKRVESPEIHQHKYIQLILHKGTKTLQWSKPVLSRQNLHTNSYRQNQSFQDKNLHTNIYSSFIQSCQNLDTTKISFNKEWINNLQHTQTIEYYLVLRKRWAIKPWKYMKESELCITKWKKTIWKYCLVYNSNYLTSWKEINTEMSGDNAKISGGQELGRR